MRRGRIRGPGGRHRKPRGPVRSALIGAAMVAASVGPAPAQVATDLDALFDAPPFDGMYVGALVVDVESGATLYARNEGRRFVPASNQKVLTTIAAMERLGPDYRFHTTVEALGEMGSSGILVGSLVVRGSGDPTLSRRFYDDDEEALGLLADQIRDAGVRRVRGDLVIDAEAWDSTRIEETWMWGDLPFGYAAVGGPFAVAEGRAQVEARAGAPGDPVSLRWWPLGDPGRFTSAARSVTPSDSAELSARLLRTALGVEVTGELSAFTVDTLELSVQDPVREAGLALVRLLGDRGVDVDGAVRVTWGESPCAVAADACGRGTVVATLESPPLTDVVQGVLEPSQNWMAEQLLAHLGAVAGGRAGWTDGARALREILQSDFAVDSLDLTLRDGSGLSAYNLVTPRALVSLLVQVHRRPWAAAYARALAEPGEDDSTLERRLDGLEGRVYAKTGTITHVNSLSGYVDTADGRRLAFAFLTNASGLRSAQVRSVVDRAVRRLADGN